MSESGGAPDLQHHLPARLKFVVERQRADLVGVVAVLAAAPQVAADLAGGAAGEVVFSLKPKLWAPVGIVSSYFARLPDPDPRGVFREVLLPAVVLQVVE